jgi:hypothetical protein
VFLLQAVHPELLGHWACRQFAAQGALARENRLQVKSHAACEPSQNGLFPDWPQRQSAYCGWAEYFLPSA